MWIHVSDSRVVASVRARDLTCDPGQSYARVDGVEGVAYRRGARPPALQDLLWWGAALLGYERLGALVDGGCPVCPGPARHGLRDAALNARQSEFVGLCEVQDDVGDRPSRTPRWGLPVGIGGVAKYPVQFVLLSRQRGHDQVHDLTLARVVNLAPTSHMQDVVQVLLVRFAGTDDNGRIGAVCALPFISPPPWISEAISPGSSPTTSGWPTQLRRSA